MAQKLESRKLDLRRVVINGGFGFLFGAVGHVWYSTL